MILYNIILTFLTTYNLNNLIYFRHDTYQTLYINHILMMNSLPILNI